jgi:hypothetical protein
LGYGHLVGSLVGGIFLFGLELFELGKEVVLEVLLFFWRLEMGLALMGLFAGS